MAVDVFVGRYRDRRIDVCQYVAVTGLEQDQDLRDRAVDGAVAQVCCPPLRRVLDEDDAHALATTLKALADPARLRLVSMIASADDGWACACDLPGPLDRSQPTISHHLSVLVKAGLLEREQRGKWAWFRVRPERLEELRSALSLG